MGLEDPPATAITDSQQTSTAVRVDEESKAGGDNLKERLLPPTQQQAANPAAAPNVVAPE